MLILGLPPPLTEGGRVGTREAGVKGLGLDLSAAPWKAFLEGSFDLRDEFNRPIRDPELEQALRATALASVFEMTFERITSLTAQVIRMLEELGRSAGRLARAAGRFVMEVAALAAARVAERGLALKFLAFAFLPILLTHLLFLPWKSHMSRSAFGGVVLRC